ncbi:hypothetical protein I656_00835 [Geobacillus sp. WSUCF1]|nr:hypothetical protein I656_00835 [Geobacillus sp. WSUCF1]
MRERKGIKRGCVEYVISRSFGSLKKIDGWEREHERMDEGEKRGASVYGVDLFIFLRQRS